MACILQAGRSESCSKQGVAPVWRKEEKGSGVMVKFGKVENSLMDYLSKNGSITLSRFRKIAGIPSYKAESILANLIIFKILVMNSFEKGFSYELYPAELPEMNQ